MAVEPGTDRLLYYSQSSTDINIPIVRAAMASSIYQHMTSWLGVQSLLVDRDALAVRYDLLNCHTAICAPVVGPTPTRLPNVLDIAATCRFRRCSMTTLTTSTWAT